MTVCYFGIYEPSFSRNRVYLSGLRAAGVTVLECRDTSRGLLKYWRLWRKHRALGAYDALIVGYPGHAVVPLAKLIARTPVTADLLGSLADAEYHSYRPSLIRRLRSGVADWLAVGCADTVLLESEAQKNYFERRFGRSSKYRILYTGADDSVFYCGVEKSRAPLTVLFRGRLTRESGILIILEAARLLQGGDIHFRILGTGALLSAAQAYIAKYALTKVELVSGYLSEEALRENVCGASLALGQFEDNPRLSRTIPHKAFEALALGIPYLSGDTPAIREIIKENETGFLVPLADPAALAGRIRELSQSRASLSRVSENGKVVFKNTFSPRVLAKQLVATST